MGLARKFGWSIYAGLLNAVTSVVTTKVVSNTWQAVTGEEPPIASDPEASTKKSVIWLLTGGLALSVVQLLVNRFAARRWIAETGKSAPSLRSVNIKV